MLHAPSNTNLKGFERKDSIYNSLNQKRQSVDHAKTFTKTTLNNSIAPFLL